MADRLKGRYPELSESIRGLGLEELREFVQTVIDECHGALSPEARDILADEGVTPDHISGIHDPDILDAAYLDAMEKGDDGAVPDLFSAARLAAAHRYAAGATTEADLHEAIYEALIAADREPKDLAALASVLG